MATSLPRLGKDIGSRRRLVRSSAAVGLAMAAGNGLTAVTQLSLARLLDPGKYSVVVTLFVVVGVAGVPLGALQAIVARNVASALADAGTAEAGAALRAAVRELVRLAVPVFVAGCLAAVPVAYVLGVHRIAALVATGVVVAASVGLTVVWGGLQGSRRFGFFAGGQVAFAVAKLGAAVGAAALGWGVTGVMAGTAVATVLTLAIGLVPLRPYLAHARAAGHLRYALLNRYSGGAALALTLYAILTTVDVAVARLALSHTQAGAYAAASVISRALLLLPVAVTTVLFPRVSTLRDEVREQRHLRAALAVTGAAGAAATLVLWVGGGEIIRTIFGADYGAAGSWVPLLGAAMTLYGLGYVYLFHTLSLGRSGFALAAWPLVAAQALAFALAHGSGRQLAFVQIAIAAAFAVTADLYHRRRA